MIDNPQLGYPDGPLPEPENAQQLDRLHQLSPDFPLPTVEPYETLTEQIPAAPLDLSTVAQHVAIQVDWRDAAEYARQYTDPIIEANQALSEDVLSNLWGSQE